MTLLLSSAAPLLLLALSALGLARAANPPALLWALAVAFPVAMALAFSRVVTEVSVPNSDTLVLRCLLRTATVESASIASIDARPTNRGMVAVRTGGGTFFLYRSMPGLLDSLRAIVAAHPAIPFKE